MVQKKSSGNTIHGKVNVLVYFLFSQLLFKNCYCCLNYIFEKDIYSVTLQTIKCAVMKVFSFHLGGRERGGHGLCLWGRGELEKTPDSLIPMFWAFFRVSLYYPWVPYIPNSMLSWLPVGIWGRPSTAGTVHFYYCQISSLT